VGRSPIAPPRLGRYYHQFCKFKSRDENCVVYYLDMNLLRFTGRILASCGSRSKHCSIRRVISARLSALGAAYVAFALKYPDMYRLIFVLDAERI